MNNIRRLRKEHKMTQTELANMCNISQGALSGYETGRYEPDNSTLMQMADIFHVTIDELLGYEGNEQHEQQTLMDRNQNTEHDDDHTKVIPKTTEARILVTGIDKMPARDRERALRMVRLMFDQYEEYFREGDDDDDT